MTNNIICNWKDLQSKTREGLMYQRKPKVKNNSTAPSAGLSIYYHKESRYATLKRPKGHNMCAFFYFLFVYLNVSCWSFWFLDLWSTGSKCFKQQFRQSWKWYLLIFSSFVWPSMFSTDNQLYGRALLHLTFETRIHFFTHTWQSCHKQTRKGHFVYQNTSKL